MDSTIDTKNRADLITHSANFTDLHDRLYDVATRAIIVSNIQKKKDLLKVGSDGVKIHAPAYAEFVKLLFENPSDSNIVGKYNQTTTSLGEAYRYLVDAVKIDEASSFSKIRELVKAITELILNAKSLHESSAELIQAITSDAPVSTRSSIAKKVHQDAQNVIRNAKIVADNVSDPTIKKLILDSIQDITLSLDELMKLANLKELSANDKNLAADAFEKLMNSVQKIVTASRTDAIESYPVHLTSEVLNSSVDKLIDAAKRGDVKGVEEKSKEVSDIADQLIQILLKKAENTTDPNEKRYLLEAADLLKKSVADVLANAKILAQDPNNIEAARNLQNSRNAFRKAIDRARGVEGTPDGFLELPKFDNLVEEEKVEAPAAQRQQFNFDFEELASDDALVKAAKEQARAALDVVREAERYLSELEGDPAKQKEIIETSDLVRELASKVVDAARRAAENPDDPKAQEEMSRYQNELALAIGKLLGLTGKGHDQNVADALKDLEDALVSENGSSDNDSGDAALANNFFKIADDMIKKIKSNFDENKASDVKKDVETARDIAILSSQANKALQELSKTVKADQFKSQISNSGKIIADNALKLKILAAVKVSGGDDNTGQVASAAHGLRVQVEEIVSQLKAGFLRHRVQATAKQTLALKKIAEAVRRARFLV